MGTEVEKKYINSEIVFDLGILDVLTGDLDFLLEEKICEISINVNQ